MVTCVQSSQVPTSTQSLQAPPGPPQSRQNTALQDLQKRLHVAHMAALSQTTHVAVLDTFFAHIEHAARRPRRRSTIFCSR